MPKVLLDYTISGSIEVEIDKERLKALNEEMKDMTEFRKCGHIQDNFSDEIWNHVESGNSREEVNEFRIEE